MADTFAKGFCVDLKFEHGGNRYGLAVPIYSKSLPEEERVGLPHVELTQEEVRLTWMMLKDLDRSMDESQKVLANGGTL